MTVAKENGLMFSSSSLNTYYRALARYLLERETNPNDITTDVRFKKVSPPGPSQYSSYQPPSEPSQISYQPTPPTQLKTDDKENMDPGQKNGPEPEENRNYDFKFRKINTGEYSYTYL